MKTIKYIREIASKLPTVYQQTVSGYYMDYNEEGDMVPFPHYVTHELNHVRRLRKAYEKTGMDGIKSYLEMIHKLQIQRNENLQRLDVPGREDVQVEHNDTQPADQSVPNTDSN